jgi:hypothetical protein
VANHSTRKDAAGTGFPIVTAMMTNGPAFDGLMQSGQACVQACSEWRNEILRFYDQRLKADEKFGTAISDCKTLAEIVDVQCNWAMAATHDYFEEGQRLAQIAAGAFPFWPRSKPAAPHKET